jgi:hypothetical protein
LFCCSLLLDKENKKKSELANAFVGTFAFFSNAQSQTKNAKEPPNVPKTLQTIDNTATTDRRTACNSGFAKKEGSVVN